MIPLFSSKSVNGFFCIESMVTGESPRLRTPFNKDADALKTGCVFTYAKMVAGYKQNGCFFTRESGIMVYLQANIGIPTTTDSG